MGDLADHVGGRWLGVGSSTVACAATAARQAAQDALVDPDVKLAVVFSSATDDLEAVVAEVGAVTNGAPMIGCSTAGELSSQGTGDGVVVALLGGPGFTAWTGRGDASGGRLRAAGASAVASTVSSPAPAAHEVVVLISDGLAGDQREVVRGAYSVVGASVPLVGGCAGDGMRMERTYQFHDGEVLTDSVVAARIVSNAPMGIGVHHGWRKVGDPMVVTASDQNRVLRLNDRPALDVYLDVLDAPAEARRDPHQFTLFAMCHPLGIDHRSGEEVRFVAGADFEQRSLTCIAELPEGGLTWIMEGDEDTVLSATTAACSAAVADLGETPPLAFLAFDCVARRGVLGDDRLAHEVGLVCDQALGAPVAGFYTYGEFARTRGATGFHNQTLVVLALG